MKAKVRLYFPLLFFAKVSKSSMGGIEHMVAAWRKPIQQNSVQTRTCNCFTVFLVFRSQTYNHRLNSISIEIKINNIIVTVKLTSCKNTIIFIYIKKSIYINILFFIYRGRGEEFKLFIIISINIINSLNSSPSEFKTYWRVESFLHNLEKKKQRQVTSFF